MKKKKNNNKLNYIIFLLFLSFIGISNLLSFDFGEKIGENFMIFARDMILILPPAFVIIGLFEIWINQETIDKSFGKVSGFKKYIYSILLAATTVGGTFVSFPVANSLYHKGAGFKAIFTYITSASLALDFLLQYIFLQLSNSNLYLPELFIEFTIHLAYK